MPGEGLALLDEAFERGEEEVLRVGHGEMRVAGRVGRGLGLLALYFPFIAEIPQ